MKNMDKKIVIEDDLNPLNIDLNVDAWEIVGDEEKNIKLGNVNGLCIENNSDKKVKLKYKKNILVKNKKCICLQMKNHGTVKKNGGVDILINGWSIPESGIMRMPLQPPINLTLELEANGDSCAIMQEMQMAFLEEDKDLTEICEKDCDILVLTPSYPSNHNLYLAAFAHSRNRVYAEKGMKIQVASLASHLWYQTSYDFEGIPVITGHTSLLKKLLAKKQYKVIITHFVDVEYYQIFDGYVTNEQLMFVCHGPETTFELLPNVARPYFTAPVPNEYGKNPVKRQYVKKYALKKNVHWVFVSEWLKKASEENLGVHFLNASCIGNIIDENAFPYVEKKAEDRKKVLVLRKFDNIAYHSIDIIVRAILALSQKSYFAELEFDIYGDGNYYEELIEPIKKFENIHFHRTFVRNSDIKEIHKNHGIMFIPSRHDSQGVSMGEAASSGVVPLGSKVTCLPYFMDDDNNKILSDPEDPYEFVKIFERLYYNPDEFLKISKNISEHIQNICGRKETIDKEVSLINKIYEEWSPKFEQFTLLKPEKEPILTIVVPAYNVEKYIEKCIWSLINHRNAAKCEILIINDGSKDHTSEIGHKFETLTHGVVKVVDKENGGHGSTINKGIEIAKGKYIKLIDGDDWVDSENLADFIDILAKEDADLFLNKGCYEFADKASLDNIINYDSLTEGTTYHYSDLLYPLYGFDTYGPLLTTSTYRTEILRQANFKLSEKKPYVDMEFNVFSQQFIDSVKYYDVDIYRYLIGRSGQTVSRDYWKGHYKDHEYVIFNILKYLNDRKEYPEQRKLYAYRHYIAQMVDSQIFMFDQISAWDELEEFLKNLKKYPEAEAMALDYIKEKKDASIYILKHYKQMINKSKKEEPLINQDGSHRLDGKKKIKIYPIIRVIIPYGLISLWRKFAVPVIRKKTEQK